MKPWHVSREDGFALFLYPTGYVVALKGPRYRALYTERNQINMRVIPLGRGWRITIRGRWK